MGSPNHGEGCADDKDEGEDDEKGDGHGEIIAKLRVRGISRESPRTCNLNINS